MGRVMKTIGLLGGMSWESTRSYYTAINRGVKEQLGGLHCAQIAMYSVDFAQIEKLQHAGDWPQTAQILAQSAKRIEAAGADFLLICTNTMHKVAPQIQAQLNIPILHIADATARLLQADGMTKVGLLGTAFTMEQDFYKGRLSEQFNIEVLVPDAQQRKLVHDVIYSELCLGELKEESREAYLDIVDDLFKRGAQAVILGCTEIALLIDQTHTKVPLYDTTKIHANAAVHAALAD